MNKLAELLIQSHERVKSARVFWEANWQDIRELCRPNGRDITKVTTPGRIKSENIFDSTAPDALEQLASGLQSYMMSPSERWFDLAVEGMEETNDHEVLTWLEAVSDVIYNQYQRPDSKLIMSASELFMDLGAYGTGVMNQEWEDDHLLFRCYGITDCWIRENYLGVVDALHRQCKMTTRQLMQEFPDSVDQKVRDEKNPDREWAVLHIVQPREGVTSSQVHQFDSYWINLDTRELLKESGYRSFPYHVPRWTKLADEIYGRSPAMKVLPDIKLVNAMAKVLIKAGQKQVDPPLVVPNDGFLLPLQTHPGALIFKEPGSDEIQPLITGQQGLSISLEMLQDRQMTIRRGFYAEWLKLEKDNKEMTAFEVADRRDEKLRLMAPMLGRQQSELLGPMIARSYELLSWHGKLPAAPESLKGMKLKIVYTSPAAKAQSAVKAIETSRFVAELLPLSQAKPEILDVIDFDQMALELARIRGISRRVIRSPDAMQNIRQSRQQQEAIANAAQVAEPATKAMKNLSDANILPMASGMSG